MSKRTNRDLHERLDALYARLPTVACRGLCGEACGPIPIAAAEAGRLRRATHQAPRTVEGACVYLTGRGRCRVYPERPLICRTWGVVKRMSCMHGCVPDRWLTDREWLTIAQAVERLAGRLHVTTDEGIVPVADSFLDMPVDGVDPAIAEADAERTRNLRALFGGRILGTLPREADGVGVVRLDDLRRRGDP